ncbi:MAG: ADP-glyceromanno-heptose 6-epimerase [Bacteroidales bacterium]|nr:ADP-glyceromanno-heptose 6-epimerase [Bacteroidales bacterium]
MIVITGAAGFIGSCMVQQLNQQGRTDLVLVDDFTRERKRRNWADKQYADKIQRNEFFAWADRNARHISGIVHLGARTDTTERDYTVFEELNVDYTQHIWSLATQHRFPMLYASSAATYGDGANGYADDESCIPQLQPLNAYGRSKNEIDKWILQQTSTPPAWAGFKFFNVYGPNEYHKDRMASVIFHAFNQIKECGRVKLFRSHRPDFADGMQLRDFVYVKDVVEVLYWFSQNRHADGIFNLGTGHARSFLDLVRATFAALQRTPDIEFVDIPEDIRDKYQYFTEAKMEKMRAAGCQQPFHSLEDGVTDYVSNYLVNDKIF